MKPLLLILSVFLTLVARSQVINTIAGVPYAPYSGDGGPAIQAGLDLWVGFKPAFDNAGNMYLPTRNTVRKISPSGIITLVAGSPMIPGYSGDGGPALNALMYHPGALVIDQFNNVIVADQLTNFLRKITPTGIITTISGPIAQTCNPFYSGPLAQAEFNYIPGLVFDQSYNLYISDLKCNVIRKVSPAGVVTTVAGNGIAGYYGDGGPATSASLRFPGHVAIDAAGNIYIPETANHRVRKVDPSGIITTIAGTGTPGFGGTGGPANAAELDYPGSVVIDQSGNLYIGCLSSIRKISPAGIITTYAGNGTLGYTGDGGPAITASIRPSNANIAIDPFGNIYFADDEVRVIRKISNCALPAITQQPSPLTLCPGSNGTFAVVTLNTSTFQWQVNTGSGFSNLTDNANYNGVNTSVLQLTNITASMNGYQFRCLFANDCAPLVSEVTSLAVSSAVTPAISITSPPDPLCKGSLATFTVSLTNQGNSPFLQWKKNGMNVGNNTTTYTDNALSTGDQLQCILTSNALCVTTATAQSNIISVTMTPSVTPTIAVSPSSTATCAGSNIVFTASSTNGGSNPVFQWTKNGNVVGANSATYSDNNLSSADAIACTLTSNATCVTTNSANSNSVSVNVTALATPSISILASANNICPGTSVSFTAKSVNPGTTPTFQWKKNGNNVSTAAIYTDNGLLHGDQLTCELTSSLTCVTSATATSDTVTISTIQNLPMQVNLGNDISTCKENLPTLNAGTGYTSYAWQNGSTTPTLTITQPGKYSVTAINACGQSFTDEILITFLPPPSAFLPLDTVVCTYGNTVLAPINSYKNYLWNTGQVSRSIPVTSPGIYWLQVKDNKGCTGSDTIVVRLKTDCMQGFYIPTAFTPNNDGKNDEFKPMIFGNINHYSFSVFNRWGKMIFTSTDPDRGWNGTILGIPQESGTYVWVCNYQLNNQVMKIEKGTVLLIK